MSNILVTGGAGFIGSHLVDELVKDKSNRVVVFDNLRRGRERNLEGSRGHIEFVKGDIRDRLAVEKAIRGIDVVYHLAAQSNVLGAVSDVDYSFTSNVCGTFEVLRAAASAGVKRLVFTSSREVYGDPKELPVAETAAIAPKNAYGASKAAGEMYCRSFMSETFHPVILRLANVYGGRDFDRVIPIFADQALRNEPLTLFGGKQILDFIWIDTVVDSLIKAAKAIPFAGPANIGCGKPTELGALAQEVVSRLASKSKINIAPAREVEVAKFVASTEVMKAKLAVEPPEEPLLHLEKVFEYLRRSGERGVSSGEKPAVLVPATGRSN